MADFIEKNSKELKKLTLEELELYYRNFRKNRYEKGIPVEIIKNHELNYQIVRNLLKLDKLISRRKTKIIGDKRIQTQKAKIYACTHIGRYDIETVIERINEPTYFLMGDPHETYRNLDGKILEKHGVIYFDMQDFLDRKISKETCIELLLKGENIFLFPEGAWNLDPLYPVQKLFPGLIEMAIYGNAEIIPVGIEQYKSLFFNNYYINIGENIDVSSESVLNKKELAENIRWKMADLKWEIFETYGKGKRANLPNMWENGYFQFINSIMCDTENDYTIEEIQKTRYHEQILPKTAEEVFYYLNKLGINEKNSKYASELSELKWELYEKYGEDEKTSLPQNWMEYYLEFVDQTKFYFSPEEIKTITFNDQILLEKGLKMAFYENRILEMEEEAIKRSKVKTMLKKNS